MPQNPERTDGTVEKQSRRLQWTRLGKHFPGQGLPHARESTAQKAWRPLRLCVDGFLQ